MEVKTSSRSNYQNLLTQFPNTLQCPCSKISMRYELFLNIQPTFHQLCSSDFVSSEWIKYKYDNGLTGQDNADNFRFSTSAQFRSLASLCQVSGQMANDSLVQLFTDHFINNELLSPSSFDEHIRTTINKFQLTIPNVFHNTLTLMRETIQANKLIAGSNSNWMIHLATNSTFESRPLVVPLVYGECSCGLSSQCTQSLNGMMTGCYPLESLLQLTLHCFFNQQCIDPVGTFKALKLFHPSRFSQNSTIQMLVDELMVEHYSSNVSYEKYFDECAPLSCIYSYIDQKNLIEGMTTLISLYGGLVIICRVVVVFIMKLCRGHPQRISPQID